MLPDRVVAVIQLRKVRLCEGREHDDSVNRDVIVQSSSKHNCCLFIDIKIYLSPAVSTIVKGVHTAGLLHLYTDYINSHIVTESKKRTIS